MNPASLCSVEDSQLLVVDVQIRLLAAMPETDRAALVKSTEILLQAADVLEIPTLYTEQYPQGLGPTIPALAERMPAMARHFEKTGFSCIVAEGFVPALKVSGRRQVVLVGQETHVCVLQTTLELIDMGVQVFVVEDAVCSRNPAHKLNALARLRDAGAVITNSESVLFEWLRDATHPHFKTFSNLIR